MALAGLFIYDRTLPADLHSLAIMTMLGRYEFDAAVAHVLALSVDP